MLGFETLTLCPIDHRMVDRNILPGDECDWLNTCHARVRTELSPRVAGVDLDWLHQATAAI